MRQTRFGVSEVYAVRATKVKLKHALNPKAPLRRLRYFLKLYCSAQCMLVFDFTNSCHCISTFHAIKIDPIILPGLLWSLRCWATESCNSRSDANWSENKESGPDLMRVPRAIFKFCSKPDLNCRLKLLRTPKLKIDLAKSSLIYGSPWVLSQFQTEPVLFTNEWINKSHCCWIMWQLTLFNSKKALNTPHFPIIINKSVDTVSRCHIFW